MTEDDLYSEYDEDFEVILGDEEQKKVTDHESAAQIAISIVEEDTERSLVLNEVLNEDPDAIEGYLVDDEAKAWKFSYRDGSMNIQYIG